MASITLNKALNLKNSLAGKIKHQRALISAHNSRNVAVPEKFNVTELISQVNQLTSDMIRLKTLIENANAPIRGKIFRISELKSAIVFIEDLDTKEGKFIRGNDYSMAAAVTEEFVCTINAKTVEELQQKMKDEIDELQEEISQFNYTTKIDF